MTRRDDRSILQGGSATPPDRADDALARAIEDANVPSLLMVLTQLTGDLRWLEPEYRCARTRGMVDDDTGGLPEYRQREVREAAREVIGHWLKDGEIAIPRPSNELITRMLSHVMGEEVPIEYGPMLTRELEEVAYRSGRKPAAAPVGADLSVLVVGAGVSGIAAGVKLAEAGIEYTIVERSDSVGGVWRENGYPGAGVDTPSLLYSYSFAEHDWSHHFATRDEVRQYLEEVASNFGVLDQIRFGVSVQAARYHPEEQIWSVDTLDSNGQHATWRVNVLISAVGAFNPPVIPNLDGLDRFAGPHFHTADWPENLDLTGKRVAVVGNGASAMQIVPAIVDSVAELTVFQRQAQWAQPFPLFKTPIREDVQQLFRRVPLYEAWTRLRLGWIFHDKLYDALQKDPDWTDPSRSVNATNDGHRRYLTQYIEEQVGSRTDLLPALVPDYPPFGKRMLMDNGWFRTMTKPNVHLVSDSILRVETNGLTTAAATYPADVLVFATGFDVVRYISTFEVRGRSGVSLRDAWSDDDGRAYLGLAVPDFPNFFCLYGPNTQSGHGGSLIFTVEAQIHYIVDLLLKTLAAGAGAVECRREVYDEYATKVDRAHERMIWTHPGMSTYYRNSRGRVVVNSPFRNVDFWSMTRSADLNDYIVSRRTSAVEGNSNGARERLDDVRSEV